MSLETPCSQKSPKSANTIVVIILCRVNVSREEAVNCIKNNDLSELLAADQLKIEQQAGNVFQVKNPKVRGLGETFASETF